MALCQQRQDAAEPQDHAGHTGMLRWVVGSTPSRHLSKTEINQSRNNGCPGQILYLFDQLCSLRGWCQTCGTLGVSTAELTLPEHCLSSTQYCQKLLISTELLAKAGSDLTHHCFTRATCASHGREAGEACGLLALLMETESQSLQL